MEVVGISGKLIRPDGVVEYWWNGVNYGNVVPEQLIDAEIEAASKNNKKVEEQRHGSGISQYKRTKGA